MKMSADFSIKATMFMRFLCFYLLCFTSIFVQAKVTDDALAVGIAACLNNQKAKSPSYPKSAQNVAKHYSELSKVTIVLQVDASKSHSKVIIVKSALPYAWRLNKETTEEEREIVNAYLAFDKETFSWGKNYLGRCAQDYAQKTNQSVSFQQPIEFVLPKDYQK